MALSEEQVDLLQNHLGVAPRTPGSPASPAQGPAVLAIKPGAATAIGDVKMGDDQATVAAQEPLGLLAYRGLRIALWAMTAPEGKLDAPGATAPMKQLAHLNSLGNLAIQAVDQMVELETAWRASHGRAHQLFEQSAAEVSQLETDSAKAKIVEAVKKGEVFQAIKEYTDELKTSGEKVQAIASAQTELKGAGLQLVTNELWRTANQQKSVVAAAAQEVEAEKKKIEDARQMAEDIFGVAKMVVQADFAGLAKKAWDKVKEAGPGLVIDAIIDSEDGARLEELQQKLNAAKQKLDEITDKALATAVEAARVNVEAKLQKLVAERQAFTNSMDKLQQDQVRASTVLGENHDPATAKLGKMLAKRDHYQQAVDAARNACANFLQGAAQAHAGTLDIVQAYRSASGFIDQAASTDPCFDRSQPCGKVLELSAIQNAYRLGNWLEWLDAVQGECQKANTWLLDEGKSGPMEPYREVNDLANGVLKIYPRGAADDAPKKAPKKGH